jgi:hypothetical protein
MKNVFLCLCAPFACTGLFARRSADAVARIRLGNNNKVSLVNRGMVDPVLREHSFQAGDWHNQRKTAELGKALNVDRIERGELAKFGSSISIGGGTGCGASSPLRRIIP